MTSMAKTIKKKAFNRIGEVLRERGVSQYRLQKESKIAYSQINAYVQNTRQPSLETLYKMAKTLGVDPCDLLNR